MPKYPPPANRRQNFPAAIGKNVAISIYFSEGPLFCSHLLKAEGAVKNFKIAQRLFLFLLFPTIPLLARLKLVRQSL
jgi:hypothetical protein